MKKYLYSGIFICSIVFNSCFSTPKLDLGVAQPKIVATGVIPYFISPGSQEVKFLFMQNGWSREKLWGDFCDNVKPHQPFGNDVADIFIAKFAAKLAHEGTMGFLANSVFDFMSSKGSVYFDFYISREEIYRLYFVRVAYFYSEFNFCNKGLGSFIAEQRIGYAWVTLKNLLNSVSNYLYYKQIAIPATYCCTYELGQNPQTIVLNTPLSAELKSPYVWYFLNSLLNY